MSNLLADKKNLLAGALGAMTFATLGRMAYKGDLPIADLIESYLADEDDVNEKGTKSKSTSKTTKTKISEIYIYPIHGCGGIKVDESLLQKQGLLFDKMFVLVQTDQKDPEGKGHCISAARTPNLVKIECQLKKKLLPINHYESLDDSEDEHNEDMNLKSTISNFQLILKSRHKENMLCPMDVNEKSPDARFYNFFMGGMFFGFFVYVLIF